MNITLRFFASVREQIGLSELELTLPDEIKTVQQLRDYLCLRGDNWAQALAANRNLRTAFNREMCEPNQELSDDAEVAFFPPVTGG